jgi:ABC-2 type transport system ATP-binding protein
MILSCKNLSKTYKSNILALDDISLEFKQGTCGILGDNGAGKTTLMQILATILTADKGGSISYNGKDIKKDISFYRSKLGFVPQECGLPEYIKVKKLLLLISQFKQLDFYDSNKQINELLEIMNLTDRANSYVKELSGGMKQRLSIIQGFLGNPEILILDEPTKGLDIHEQNNVYEFIHDYNKEIILISSHITQDIEATCESVIIINKGRILYFGKIEDLINYSGKVSLREAYLYILKENNNENEAYFK